MRSSRFAIAGAFVWGALCRTGSAERLPIRSYSVADGLPSNTINAIIRDSRGYLWFATREGLARFDGYEFSTYGRANGLPRDNVLDFIQTRTETYWAATADGVTKFEPNAPAASKFTAVGPENVSNRVMNVLYEDRAGTLWCGGEAGLFRLRTPDTSGHAWRLESVPLMLASGGPVPDQSLISLFEDSHGDLWIGSHHSLYRRKPDGHITENQKISPEGFDYVWNAVSEDRKGRLWAATGFGLFRVIPNGPEAFTVAPVYLPKRRVVIWTMLEDPRGHIWLAASNGLLRWNPDGPPTQQPRRYTERNGLTYAEVTALCRDREENLWLGSAGGGTMRISKNGYITYTADDRASFNDQAQPALFHDRSGDVHVAFHHTLNVLSGNSFLEITAAIPRRITPSWGWHQTVLQDKEGEWWIPTGDGLVRFPSVPVGGLNRTPPKNIYTTRDGLRTNDIFRVFEDSRGGVWIACIGPHDINGLSRWDRRTQSFRHFSAHSFTVATAFAEDRQGSIWIGYYTGGLARFRNDSFTFYGPEHGLTGGLIQALHIDHDGRLWIASLRGLVRVDAPAKEQPLFTRFGASDGLSSNIMLCVTEDPWGRVYLATSRGIDRIPPNGRIAPGHVKHYTQADGLAPGDIRDILFDRTGILWCATKQGISRFEPEPDGPRAPPPNYIRQLRVRGVPYASWDLGVTAAPKLTLAPQQNQLQIDFGGLKFAPGDVFKYQYKLEPADQDWSPASDQRTVNYSDVAPGTYRFQVRLITDGAVSSDPAILQFIVLAPLWQRWWFRLLLALGAIALMFWLHRARVFRLLELERIRTRIATDLHDDIGSGLSQIAILTEVAHRRVPEGPLDLKTDLTRIGSVSRELAESMSDIVWSVNPQRDNLNDLVQRMRRFSSDLFSDRGVEFDFHVSTPEEAVPVTSDVRREVYLIFKEALNNAARHSHCTRGEIAISIDNNCLRLRIEDNGRGLDSGGNGDSGNGLRNMTERARRIGAHIEFGSARHGGTRVVLLASLRATGLTSRRTT
jgi:ligand-binding sensor domain-containing protein/two-component sensor histidine kinase